MFPISLVIFSTFFLLSHPRRHCHVFGLLQIKAHGTNARISAHAHNVNRWLNTLHPLGPLKLNRRPGRLLGHLRYAS